MLHPPHGIIIMSKIKNHAPFDSFIHHILRLLRKMASKSTSHFHPCLPTFQQRAERATPATQMKSFRCPAPVTQNEASDLKMSRMPHSCHTKRTWLKKTVRRASKTRPSEEPKPHRTSCASLSSRHAHGHLTRELLRQN